MVREDLLDDDIYLSERFTRGQALVDLIMLSSYADRNFRIRGNKVELKRGQVAKSLRELSVRWQWSVNTVSKFLKELQEDGYIDTQKTSVNQVITIKKYLIVNTQNDTQIDTLNDTQSDTPIIYNKDIKEIKEKEDTNVSPQKKTWRDDYGLYVKLIDEALCKLFEDKEYQSQMEQLYTNIDYKRTLIACSLYWKEKEQWETYKRKKKLKNPNFVSAIKNGFHINKVYKSKYDNEVSDYGYPRSVDDVRKDDICHTHLEFRYWLDKVAPKMCDELRGGWPDGEKQYQNLIGHTIGGAKALCYVVLVFQRDGWERYYDKRGFMYTYANYIKANGLFKE